MRRAGTLALTLALTASALGAQQPPDPAREALYRRAHRMVGEGLGDAGRAIVESLVVASPPGQPAHAEALFWRASLAPSAEVAERDYRRIAVEYPLSHRAPDALLRLAQLELARGDRALALRHLERLQLEHPMGPAHTRASYWRARILFEVGDLPGACAAAGSAAAAAGLGDGELRAQLATFESRCRGVDTVAAGGAARSERAVTAGAVTPPAPGAFDAVASDVAAVLRARIDTLDDARIDSITRGRADSIAAVARADSIARARADSLDDARTDSAIIARADSALRAVERGLDTPPAPPAASAEARPDSAVFVRVPRADTVVAVRTSPPVTPVRPPTTTARAPASSPAPTTRRAPGWSVQVGAFPTEALAADERDKLAARGYEARIVFQAPHYKVRVGRWPTRRAAATAAAEMTAKRIATYVTEAEP